MNETQLAALIAYVNEQAELADRSSHEWASVSAQEQAAYRSGMWYSYNDIRERLGACKGRPLSITTD